MESLKDSAVFFVNKLDKKIKKCRINTNSNY
nr:MAG TPA: hypothetical protein [Caudoviricetes sp.]